jgi:hypothetical protein
MTIDDLIANVVLSIGLAILNGDTTDDKALPYKTEIRERVANLEKQVELGRKAVSLVEKIRGYIDTIPFYDCDGCNNIHFLLLEYEKNLTKEERT